MSKSLTKKYTFLQEDASKETENYHESICHFTICIFPLIEMFHSRPIDHKISKLHEEALRIVYKDHFTKYYHEVGMEKCIKYGKSAYFLHFEFRMKEILFISLDFNVSVWNSRICPII